MKTVIPENSPFQQEEHHENNSRLTDFQNNVSSNMNLTCDHSILSENHVSLDEDRENENPDPTRIMKRKNSSRDSMESDRPKLLRKNSNLPEFSESNLAESLVPATLNKNGFSNDHSEFMPFNSTHDIHMKDYFSLLPDEVLLLIFNIFQHKPTLVNCACVCRRWKNVAYDVNLWSRIELSQHKIESGIMEVILNRKPVIMRMSQSKVVSPIFKNVDYGLSNVFSKLEYLDLSMASVSPEDLMLLLQTCQNLLKLSLEYVEVNERVCEEIAKNSSLCVLNMAQCGGLNEFSLKPILSNCEKLIELNLAWTYLNAAAIKCVCHCLSKDIARLNLSGCLKEMTDNHVSALVLRCNKLIELDLSDATGISESSIEAICGNLNKLEVLSLSRCYNIFPASYSKLFRLPSIAHLNIFGLFTDTQIETLRKTAHVKLNMMKFSYIARPTVGHRRTSIWGMQVRD